MVCQELQLVKVFTKVKPGVSDRETEYLVNEKVDAFWRGIEGGANKRGTVSVHLIQFRTNNDDGSQITVTLSEKKLKKNWFSIGEEDVPWEQWYAFFFYGDRHIN